MNNYVYYYEHTMNNLTYTLCILSSFALDGRADNIIMIVPSIAVTVTAAITITVTITIILTTINYDYSLTVTITTSMLITTITVNTTTIIHYCHY